MADKKISALTASTTPLAGTEVLPIVQGGATVKVSVADLTAGRAISATQLTLSTGNLIVSNGKGIDFSATAGAGTSELLADYEEGTFTPTITYSGGNGNLSYSQQIGLYTLIGRCVTFEVRVLFGETTASGYIASINGLPFTSKAASYAGGGMFIDNMSLLAGGGQWVIGPSVTIIEPSVSGTGGASVINSTSTGAANNLIQISGLYYV
jgi:hypothetical protein